MKNILISLCCFSIVCSAAGQTAQMVQDSQNIQALFEAMSKAWNIHDAKAYSMAFLEEAVDVWWEMNGAKTPDGKNIPPGKGLSNLLMTRNADQWLILIMHNMNLPGS